MNNCYGIFLLPSGLTTSLQRLWDVYMTSAMSYRHTSYMRWNYVVCLLGVFSFSIRRFCNWLWTNIFLMGYDFYICVRMLLCSSITLFLWSHNNLNKNFSQIQTFPKYSSLFWMNNIYLGNCWGRNTERFVIVIDF